MWVPKIRRFLLREDGVTAVAYAAMLAVVGAVCLAAVTTGVQFNRFLRRLIGAGEPETNGAPHPESARDSGLGAPQGNTRSER
jgi:Flp pilus assembly pilin Flp